MDRAKLKQKMRWWVIGGVALVCVVGGVVVAVRSLPAPHLTVEVVNETGAPMAGVHFLYADGHGRCASEQIPKGGKIAWDVSGRSRGFSLDYRDANDRVVTRKCDFSFNGDDWGTMSLHVKHDRMKVLTEVDAVAKH